MAPFTPSYLPHRGGGFSPLVELDHASPTGRHRPLDGGGWEGVSGAMIAGSPT